MNFSPAMSANKKAKGKQIRDWHLNRRSGSDLQPRPGHQSPGPRLDQLLRSLLSLQVVFSSPGASTSIWSDGPCRSSNDCEGNLSWHGTGCVRNNSAIPGSSPIGTFFATTPNRPARAG